MIISYFLSGQGQLNYTARNIFSGPLPQRAYLFFLPSAAFLGSYDTNPLIFWHHNISKVNFIIDGVSIRGKPISTDFDPDNPNYLDAYKSLFEALRCVNNSMELDITYYKYARQCCLFGIDISADLSYDSSAKMGSFSIDVQFSAAPRVPLKGVCVGEFNCGMEIDKDRKVNVFLR